MEQQFPARISAVYCSGAQLLYSTDCLLALVLGSGATLVDGSPAALKPGTLVFLPAAPDSRQTAARLELGRGSSAIYAVLEPVFLEHMLGTPRISTVHVMTEGIETAAEKLIELFDLHYNRPEGTALRKYGVFFALLTALEPLMGELPPTGPAVAGLAEKNPVAAYLHQHFREPVQLADLSREFGVSRQHISSSFHRDMGVSFSAYLQNLRLREAERLLVAGDQTLTDVAHDSGFPNLKSFNLEFRRNHGCSPKQFREKYAIRRRSAIEAPAEEVLQDINRLLTPYRMVYAKSEEELHITDVVPAGEGRPFAPKWSDMVNVDISANCLQTNVQAQIRELQEALHFRYVRLGNLFCESLIPYISTLQRHRFTYFISLIDFFKSIGLTPMLAFGDSYQVSANAIMVEDGAYSVAEEDWLQMLSQLLEVSIKRWGKRWVSTWRFEFHMPERLFQSSDPEQFLDLFAHSMEVIRRELPDAQIGGPALPWDNGHLERWQHWFEGVERRRLQVDFVSMELWGDYTMRVDGFSGQFGEWRETRTIESISAADASLAVQKVQSVHGRMARHGLAAAKLYVSALGITKTQAMAAQISGHCSAYLLKCAMELQELTDGLGCWKLLNHEAEYADEFRILSSGCGLLSRFGLKNPNWYAYCFLGKMLPQVVYRGWNSLVTTDGYGRYAIVLHNCKAYTPYFFKHYLDDTALDFQNTRFYTDHAAVAQTLSLEGMEAATYQVRQYLVGDHHGCIASAMRQLGISESLTASDIRYVAAQSQPYQHIYRVRADGTLKLSVTLQPNESMLLLVSTEESMES